MKDFILSALIGFVIFLLFMLENYVWFVKVYLVRKRDKEENFIKRHREFQTYLEQVKSGKIAPYPEIEEFLSKNSAKYECFWTSVLFKCLALYLYGVVIAIIIVSVVSSMIAKHLYFFILPAVLFIVAIGFWTKHNKSTTMLFELDSILDDYN
jgi:hypothetical protein